MTDKASEAIHAVAEAIRHENACEERVARLRDELGEASDALSEAHQTTRQARAALNTMIGSLV